MPIRYTVVSTKVADDQLLSIWLSSPGDRAAISQASHELDLDLHHDADSKGSLRPTTDRPTRRFLTRAPLGVYFEVSEPDRLVRIVGYLKLGTTP